MRRRILTIFAIAAISAGAPLLAGCGGGGLDGAGGAGASIPAGAELLPASTAVLVTINGDFESPEWQAVNALVARFPSGSKLIETALSSIEESDVSFENDVKPALGPEIDLAILDLKSTDNPPVVLLTQPRDPAKLEALLAKGKEKPVWRVENGWYVVADSQAMIDQVLDGAKSNPLAKDVKFQDAIGGLTGNPVARLYLNGEPLGDAFRTQVEKSGNGVDLGSLGTGHLDAIALGVTAEGQGAQVEALVRGEGDVQLEDDTGKLLDVVPSGALGVASFSGLDKGLKQFLDIVGKQTPDFDQSLSQLELALGVSVEKDLLPVFAGEGALYVRPGAPSPEVTLLVSPASPVKALETLDKLTGGIGVLGALAGKTSFKVSTTDIAGVTAKQIQVGDKLSLYYARVGDHLVVTTAFKGIADVVAGSGSITDTPLFQQARAAAGLPAETAGFVYVDLKDSLPLLEQAGAFKGADPQVVENLRPLQYLLVYASRIEGGGTRLTGFVGIE